MMSRNSGPTLEKGGGHAKSKTLSGMIGRQRPRQIPLDEVKCAQTVKRMLSISE
jgi:hypothetical protein